MSGIIIPWGSRVYNKVLLDHCWSLLDIRKSQEFFFLILIPRPHPQIPRSEMRPSYRHSKNSPFDSNVQSGCKPLGYKNKWPLLSPFENNIIGALLSLKSEKRRMRGEKTFIPLLIINSPHWSHRSNPRTTTWNS